MTNHRLIKAPRSFKARLPVNSLGVGFSCTKGRKATRSCHHSLSLRRTITAIDFGGNNIHCEHRCFSSGPGSTMVVHFATGGGRSISFRVRVGVVAGTSMEARSKVLICSKRTLSPGLNANNIRFRNHIVLGTSGNAIRRTNSYVQMGKTSTIALVTSMHASCGGPSFHSLYGGAVRSTIITSFGSVGRRRVTSCTPLFTQISLHLKASPTDGLPISGH